jgi:hypothetical protein
VKEHNELHVFTFLFNEDINQKLVENKGLVMNSVCTCSFLACIESLL